MDHKSMRIFCFRGVDFMASIENARKKINEIDEKMAKLFVERMEASEEVFEYKKENGLPITDEKREAIVIKNNSERVENELYRNYYIDFIKDVMEISKKYQSYMQNGVKVAYSGIKGAFAHIAAEQIFPDACLKSYPDFISAYKSVEKGECDLAVLPIENSYAGEVSTVIDLMYGGSLFITGVYSLEVNQNLVGLKGADKNRIKTVISHTQALQQCAEYIKENNLEIVEETNTAIAAKKVSDMNNPEIGAISSSFAAEIYGLEVLDKNINKSNVNTTRFAVLSRIKTGEKNDTSVLMFSVSHEAGSLAKAINIIGKYGYNMTALRSRPVKDTPWQYYFYAELDGDTNSDLGKIMLKELQEFCDTIKVAGTYTLKKL